MFKRTRILTLGAAASLSFVVGVAPAIVRGQMPLSAPRYAIKDVKIVTVSGATIEKGTVVMRGGLIEDVGASVTAPADAVVIDGTGLTVYPGLIDMANTAAIEPSSAASADTAQAARGGGGGRGAAGRGATPGGEETPTWVGNERTRREALLRADFDAASEVRFEGDEMRQMAIAGVTSVLATPTQGLVRGQSALVNVLAPPDPVEISQVGGYRRGYVVVRAKVAEHVGTGAGRGGGGGYPGALLGTIAFVRQSFYDAAWQKDARAFAARHADAPLPDFEPVLDALAPTLDGKMPVAFDANQSREILRALALAKEFKLTPIIVGAAEGGAVADELKAAATTVIWAPPSQTGGGGGGRGGGQGAAPPAQSPAARGGGPGVPASLDKAGVTFAFGTNGAPTADLLRSAQRAVKQGGLSADVAVRALTINAARIAGVADRLGSIEKGKIANVIVTDGDLITEGTHVKHVFVGGYPADLTPPPASGTGGRRGGG